MPRVLLVTGRTGIAEATVQLALDRGWQVFSAGLENVGDLRDEAVAERACAETIGRYGRIDALFNVAGISGRKFGDGPVHECTLEGWHATMSNNVQSMFLMCRAVLRHWVGRAHGPS